MTAKSYTNTSQQRLLRVLHALFSDVVMGLPPSAIAKAVAASPSVITRDLNNLRTAGWAERDEATGLWRLTPVLPRQAIKVQAAISRHESRIDETRQRYTRNPD